MFEIYSVGDAAFLEQILIAVAMVTSTGSFEKMVAIGLLIGVIFIFAQSILQGATQVNFQQILLGYIIYAMFFIPTVTVTIEDSYSGEVRVVANVPLGVGAAGGIISTVGYNITQLFEQGYGVITPSVTDTKFAESLTILNSLRKEVASTPVYTAMNQSISPNADIEMSWNNYIRECTLTAVDLGERRLSDITSEAIPEAYKFSSDLYGTRLYLDSSDGTDYTCSDGYTRLIQATASGISGSTYTSQAIINLLGIDNTYTGKTGQAYISDALNSLGVISTSGTEYLTAAVVEPIYFAAAEGRYSDFQDLSSAMMINQAIQQRNTQWAAEQSMFMTIARPMMTFFEGFVYAITPFMGFLIVLGSFGLGLAGKYFQTLLWIQLWMPVLSIINLYIHTSATAQLSNLSGPLTSMYALNKSTAQLQDWVATGGMLAAATPIISLFIVTGSTYAFTSLAGRISGQDHIDEKVQSKDLLDNGPISNNAASNEYNDLTGMASTGAAGLMGSISFGSGLNNMTSSAYQKMKTDQASFAESLGASFSSGQMDAQTYSQAASIGRTHSATYGQTEGIVNERANQIMENTSIGSEHTDAVKGVVSAVASGAISGEMGKKMVNQLADQYGIGEDTSQKTPISADSKNPKATAERALSTKKGTARSETASSSNGGGLKGETGLKVGANKETSDTRSTKSSNNTAVSDALRFSEQEQAQVSNNLASAITESSNDASTSSLNSQQSQSLVASSQQLLSSAESYSELASMSQQYSAANNLSLRDVASQVSRDGEAMSGLNTYWNTGGVSAETKDEAQELYQRYSAPSTQGGYGLDSSSALAAARIKALQNSNNHSDTSGQQYQNNFSAALGAVGKSMGLSVNPPGGFERNAGLENIDNNSIQGKVKEATSDVEGAVSGAQSLQASDSQGGPAYTDPVTSTEAPQAVMAEANSNSEKITDSGAKKEAARQSNFEEQARQQYISNAPEYSRLGAAEFYGAVENLDDWVSRRGEEAMNAGESLVNAAWAGIKGAAEAFDNKMDELQNDPNARRMFILANLVEDEEAANSGFMGELTSGITSAGRSILGAAAAGMELVNGDMSFSDLSGMSLEEKGMVYQAGIVHAASQGGEAAVQQFKDDFGVDFKDDFYNEGVSRGLTHEQAQVYAESFDQGPDISNISGTPSSRDVAIQELMETYAERNRAGDIIRNDDGSPYLTEENQAFADRLVNDITESTRAGSDLSGSYLAGISHYNNMVNQSIFENDQPPGGDVSLGPITAR
ncbi:conjugal transfer protein TraG N-terminal domain-containing protein [Marinomonas algarum]|uniref:Conjugal transfer protein TraG N-terminal domain-containing protein n=1 Tax=Marinomonas algarum TaxID=2883105 RepID=A0A9X1IQF8_9GAMM|nr:conjugal transfer protein TraG N-terminal domain-containing protein [Marinomonas algarum]MCB5162606.1 conjugal transfer protein TraG N-terminal domain-containing protein [Marinomonas algarum]